jgi:hypothetical protein
VSDGAADAFYEQFEESSNKLVFAASVGLFLAAFMIVFQPFGVTNHDPDFRINLQFVVVMFSFAALVTAVLLLNEFLLRAVLVPVTDRKSLIWWLSWTYLLVGSVVFLLYNAFGNWHDFRFSSWLEFLRDVGLVISFPVTGYLFYLRHLALRSEFVRLQSEPPDPSDRSLTFTSENGKDALIVTSADVLYLESEDNYVNIAYLEGDAPKSHLVRSSLKRLEDQVEDPRLLRCHRSFIVNLGRVRSCRGNRHGLRLKLAGMDGVVPVSRKYVDRTLDSLQAGAPDKRP